MEGRRWSCWAARLTRSTGIGEGEGDGDGEVPVDVDSPRCDAEKARPAIFQSDYTDGSISSLSYRDAKGWTYLGVYEYTLGGQITVHEPGTLV